jgi:hypothetical protein
VGWEGSREAMERLFEDATPGWESEAIIATCSLEVRVEDGYLSLLFEMLTESNPVATPDF